MLSNPDPDSAVDRLAMFLRTTRSKELERRFSEDRRKHVSPGRQRRNLSVDDKEAIAARLAPTTVFDLFWRLRTKANYDDADTFVLGAGGVADARAFADSSATPPSGMAGCAFWAVLQMRREPVRGSCDTVH